jgi:hypothetical protein
LTRSSRSSLSVAITSSALHASTSHVMTISCQIRRLHAGPQSVEACELMFTDDHMEAHMAQATPRTSAGTLTEPVQHLQFHRSEVH